ncbi:hypothetical protein [Thermococcus sp. 21S7]|uniref:hypothetical protein n=1 Tax=Thermococcus sp. 21S7 TaxID=1638221 RepID=UPI00143B7D8B|nr:hypothetical protein [Thermococcus sp. 21S7]NJE61896.1 hypothetical protein [Thermococcus sp. 21S7]
MDGRLKISIGFLLFLITFLLVSITYSSVRGLYVLALNSTVLFPWLVLTLNGYGKLPKRAAGLLIGVTLVLPLLSALFLGIIYENWNLAMGFIFLFITLVMFALILIYLKITIERSGKRVKYDSRDMKVFWLIQWALNYYVIVQVGKNIVPLLIPVLLGGYLVFSGTAELKISNHLSE